MDRAELVRRLRSIEHDRPAVMTILHKDSGDVLARCTGEALFTLMTNILDSEHTGSESSHWLWRHLAEAAPITDGGAVFEALRRRAQGLAGETLEETALAYLQEGK